jgi:hypothetical protein
LIFKIFDKEESYKIAAVCSSAMLSVGTGKSDYLTRLMLIKEIRKYFQVYANKIPVPGIISGSIDLSECKYQGIDVVHKDRQEFQRQIIKSIKSSGF